VARVVLAHAFDQRGRFRQLACRQLRLRLHQQVGQCVFASFERCVEVGLQQQDAW
jgi:hypothetical protein